MALYETKLEQWKPQTGKLKINAIDYETKLIEDNIFFMI